MRRYKISGRSSTISHAFASALATVDVYDETTLIDSLKLLGQEIEEPLRCVYCMSPARSIDHLNGLVDNKRYTGHGHVIGNLVPSCERCNTSKGGKPWREFAKSIEMPKEQFDRIASYETKAPPAVSEAELKLHYPDLMEAYERLRNLTQDLLRAADNIATEIQRLESHRLGRNNL